MHFETAREVQQELRRVGPIRRTDEERVGVAEQQLVAFWTPDRIYQDGSPDPGPVSTGGEVVDPELHAVESLDHGGEPAAVGAVREGGERLPTHWQRVDPPVGEMDQVSHRPIVPLGVHQGARGRDGITPVPGVVGQADAGRHPHGPTDSAGLEIHRCREQIGAAGQVGQIPPLDQLEGRAEDSIAVLRAPQWPPDGGIAELDPGAPLLLAPAT